MSRPRPTPRSLDKRRDPRDTPPAVQLDSGSVCPAHNPVQHRDGRPPWCHLCGFGVGGHALPADPVRPAEPAHTPPPRTRVRVTFAGGEAREGIVVGPGEQFAGLPGVHVQWEDGSTSTVPHINCRVLPAIAEAPR